MTDRTERSRLHVLNHHGIYRLSPPYIGMSALVVNGPSGFHYINDNHIGDYTGDHETFWDSDEKELASVNEAALSLIQVES